MVDLGLKVEDSLPPQPRHHSVEGILAVLQKEFVGERITKIEFDPTGTMLVIWTDANDYCLVAGLSNTGGIFFARSRKA